MGHSMGGHGALTIALKNPEKYASVSAFAPICNPIKCPWGQKAFNGYLGVCVPSVVYVCSYQMNWGQKAFNGYLGVCVPNMHTCS